MPPPYWSPVFNGGGHFRSMIPSSCVCEPCAEGFRCERLGESGIASESCGCVPVGQ